MIEIPKNDMVVHRSAYRHGDAVETAAARWAYAVTIPFATASAEARGITVVAEFEVHHGQVGVGILNAGGDAFVLERLAGPGARRVVLTAPSAQPGSIVFRNTSTDGSTRFLIRRVTIDETCPAYPVHLAPRDVGSEAIPEGGGIVVFDDDAASAINIARMNFIRDSGLSFVGRTVLDVGAGVGHFSRLYTSLGASVVAVEGRSDNVIVLRERYPEVSAHVGDVQSMDLTTLGRFDVVHCFGLLYHLDSPVAAMRRLESVCADVLLLETMVCDAATPVMVLADETMAMNQALAGLGCRPSPSFVALALNRVGFSYVYGAAKPPDHPDFHFEWRGEMETSRDGHNLRCVFIASRRRIDLPALVPLIDPD